MVVNLKNIGKVDWGQNVTPGTAQRSAATTSQNLSIFGGNQTASPSTVVGVDTKNSGSLFANGTSNSATGIGKISVFGQSNASTVNSSKSNIDSLDFSASTQTQNSNNNSDSAMAGVSAGISGAANVGGAVAVSMTSDKLSSIEANAASTNDKGELQNLKSDAEAVSPENAENVQNAEQNVQNAEQKNDVAQDKKTADETQKKDADTKEQAAKEKETSLSTKVQNAKSAKESADKKVETAKQEVEAKKTEVDTAKTNVATAEQELQQAQSMPDDDPGKAAAVAAAEAKVTEAKAEQTKAEAALEEAEGKQKTAEQEQSTAENNLKTAEQELQKAEAELASAINWGQIKLAALTSSISTATATLGNVTTALTTKDDATSSTAGQQVATVQSIEEQLSNEAASKYAAQAVGGGSGMAKTSGQNGQAVTATNPFVQSTVANNNTTQNTSPENKNFFKFTV